jgi:hypothetical protein
MERNVYAPPTAAVADPVAPREERPLEVVRAVRLLWISLAISVIGLLARYLLEISIGLIVYLLISGGARYLISTWIILRIAGGHNWARIVFLVVFLAGLGYMIFNWRSYAQYFTGERPLYALELAAKTLLDLGAACLLFMPRANRWFKPPRTLGTSAESLTSQPPSA